MRVWSEREKGDWEACVATSYARGLLYGGVSMAAPYTQAEREKLEVVPDESQNLASTDLMALKVYGVKLRPVTVSTIEQAVARVGVGLCLTGKGSPGIQYQPGFAGLHEIFMVPLSSTKAAVCDPLAPDGAESQVLDASKVIAWVKNAGKGVGPSDAREVKENEFMSVVTRTLFDPERTVSFTEAGVYTGYKLDGSKKVYSLARASSAPASAAVVIDQPSDPKGPGWVEIAGGVWKGYLMKVGGNVVLQDAPKPEPVDCTAAIAEAVAPLTAKITSLEGLLADAKKAAVILKRFGEE